MDKDDKAVADEPIEEIEAVEEIESEEIDPDEEAEDDEEDGDEEEEEDDEDGQDEAGFAPGESARRVTGVQASWTESEPGEEGAFRLRLLLDDGAEGHILEVDSDDLEPILALVKASDGVTFDDNRKMLSFGTLKLD